MISKEDNVIELFFNSSRYWHFNELLEKSGLSRSRLSEWLKKFEKEKLIKKVKQKGKMPFYVRVFENKNFQYKKRLFALKKLTETGFLNHLYSLPKAQVVIIFGSFSSYDWHTNSDIDVFIYGKDDEFNQGKYETIFNRQIQVHIAKNQEDLKRIKNMLPYIIAGDFVKGSINDLNVVINAKN